MQTDVIVLGAGMVGVSAAVHLKQKGKSVVLVDRRGAGEETSYGNTGIIEADAFTPVGFPRKLRDLVRYGLNLGTEANYHPSYLLKAAP
ncbi:FAD-dependent oxidoreductase, partial [Acinetobacter baumannii]